MGTRLYLYGRRVLIMETIIVYKFALYDSEGNLVMSTELDDCDITADLELWETFTENPEEFRLVYLGNDIETIERG
jgi:hypothetical protein